MIFNRRNGRDRAVGTYPTEPWWMSYTGLAPREMYLRVVRLYKFAEEDRQRAERLLAEQRKQLTELSVAERRLRVELGRITEKVNTNEALKAEVRELQRMLHAERSEIRGALSRVSVYEGIVEHAPLAHMVAELGRDHDELESRIEAVLDVILTRVAFDGLSHETDEYTTLNKIAGLLQGQVPRVPDTPEELIEEGDGSSDGPPAGLPG